MSSIKKNSTTTIYIPIKIDTNTLFNIDSFLEKYNNNKHLKALREIIVNKRVKDDVISKFSL